MANPVIAGIKDVGSRVFGGYAELLRIPHTARYAIGAVIACMPFPMVGMTITISVQHYYGNYSLAGALTAVQAISLAIASPMLGKLVDKFGQRQVSIPTICVWMVAAFSLVTAITSHAPEWVLFCIVPFMAADECMWVIGNPLASTLAVISGVLSFTFTGVCVLVGALMFLTELTTEPKSQTQLAREAGMTRAEYRAHVAAQAAALRGKDEDESKGKASIISAGLIAVCVTWFSIGAFQSATSISIIAFATEQNMKQYTGFVFACFSFSSLIGALVYGAKNWRIPLWKRFYFCLAVVNIGIGSFLFAKHLWVIMLIYLLIGVCQAPTWVNGNQLMLHLVPPTRFTEGMAWMGAMNSIGSSAGSAIAGQFIDRFGAHGGFMVVTVLALASLAIAFVGFKQIKESTETPDLTELAV